MQEHREGRSRAGGGWANAHVNPTGQATCCRSRGVARRPRSCRGSIPDVRRPFSRAMRSAARIAVGVCNGQPRSSRPCGSSQPLRRQSRTVAGFTPTSRAASGVRSIPSPRVGRIVTAPVQQKCPGCKIARGIKVTPVFSVVPNPLGVKLRGCEPVASASTITQIPGALLVVAALAAAAGLNPP